MANLKTKKSNSLNKIYALHGRYDLVEEVEISNVNYLIKFYISHAILFVL